MLRRAVEVVPSAEALAKRGARRFTGAARASIAARGVFRVALSGGATPRGVYEQIAAPTASDHAALDWSRIHVFWGDERTVAPDHAESNYRMVHEALLAKVKIPEANVHRIHGEDPDPNHAADAYEAELIASFASKQNEAPRFDLILLGMGTDGHTASIFPGSPALESARLVAATWVDAVSAYRITLTPRVIDHAASVLFLVSGTEKARMLQRVLEGPFQPERYPAQIVRPKNGETNWLVDAAAAVLIKPSKPDATP